MATIAATIVGGKPLGNPPRGTLYIEWGPIASGDVGAAVEVPNHPDKTVQISGTFGDGTMSIQGTNETNPDGTPVLASFLPLVDPQGGVITATSAKIEQILENPRWIRPSMSGATGSAMKVTIMARRERGAKS
jgi:hypothetical protein